MDTPRIASTRDYNSEDLAIDWGVPVSAVREWLDSGALPRNDAALVTRKELLAFVNSTEGQALLRAARG